LSELFGGIAGEPVQVELSGMRILFELLGFLLSVSYRRTMVDLTCRGMCVYNDHGVNSISHD